MPTVLLVDDDPDHRHLVQVWLTRLGHRVHTAGSATEAVRMLEEHGVPDLAIVDIVLGHVDGLALIGLLRSQPLTQQMPVILLTARELDTDLVDARALDALLMKKPVERTVLAETIEQVLQQAQLLM